MELDRKSIDLLRYVQKNPDKDLNEVYKEIGGGVIEALEYLHKHGYIERLARPAGGFWNRYHASPKGNAAIESVDSNRRKSVFSALRWLVDVAIAIAAFAAGYFFKS